MRQGTVTGHDPVGFLRLCGIRQLRRTQQFHGQHIRRLIDILKDTTQRLKQQHSLAVGLTRIVLNELLKLGLSAICFGPQGARLRNTSGGIVVVHKRLFLSTCTKQRKTQKQN